MQDINDLLSDKYTSEESKMILSAYLYAKTYHNGQYRDSGEEYIMHPLSVAFILGEMNVDVDTICAGLLHDILEDTNATKEEISEVFNPHIALLVEGITKTSKKYFETKKEQSLSNSRKIITSIFEDPRVIIIKLADRLHNMRTLEYKSLEKQKENALETLEIFVPLAYLIGAYKIKNELEDLSFKYLNPNLYMKINDKKESVLSVYEDSAKEMLQKISRILNDRNIPNEIKFRIKSIYEIYKKINSDGEIKNIYDLIALKSLVDSVDNCYITLGLIHSKYKPINNRFKDYIASPKTNMYSSLHTTVFGPNDKLIEVQIRTFDMERIALYGLAGMVNKDSENATDQFQFYKYLSEINDIYKDDEEFLTHVKDELLSNKIYVYDYDGKQYELPNGSTLIDFAYRLGESSGNALIGGYVNGELSCIDRVLKNKDIVKVLLDNEITLKSEWENIAYTSHAKELIKKNVNKKEN